jgi:SAM-dependent methyltransferase
MDDATYFEHLGTRSQLSLIYRHLILYRRLCRHLSGRTLDIGCGLGDFLAYRNHTVGADTNALVVDWCCKQGLDARLTSNDHLPFDDEAFDCAVMDNVLEHIDHPDALLVEVRRVMRPEGRFVVGMPGRLGFEADADHRVFYDEIRLEQTLARFGFSPVTFFYSPFRSRWLDTRMRQYCVYGVFRLN